MQSKEYGRALLDFKNAIQVMPKDAEPYYQLGLAYLANSDIKSAYACFHKATDLNPHHTGAQLKMAEILALKGNKQMVEDAAKRATDIIAKGADPEAFDTLAFAEYRLGNAEDAEKVLDQALQKFPSSLSSSVALAKMRLERKDLKGAEEALQQAVSNDPKSSHPHVALGALYLAEQKIPDAEQQFRTALTIDPQDGPALLKLGAIELQTGHADDADRIFKKVSALPDKQYRPVHAIFLFRTGKRDAALAEFERIAKADPSDRDAESRLVGAYVAANRPGDAERVLNANLKNNPKNVDALLLRSRLYLRMGKPDAAKADLTQAIGYRNESADAHYLLAQVYGIKGNVEQQRQEFGEALRLNPHYLPARLALGESLMRSNSPQSALNILNEAPKDQQGMPAVIVQRATAMLALGQIEASRSTLAPLLSANPTHDAVVLNGMIDFIARDYPGARKSAEQVLQMNPTDIRALDILFRTYAAQKQIPGGVQAIRSYASKSPTSAPVQNLLGNVLLAADNRQQAREAFAAATAADPNYSPALLALAQLDIADHKVDRARPVLQRLSAAGDVPATLLLADLEFSSGNKDGAMAGYRKVLDKDPNNIAALNNLAFLTVEYTHSLDEGLKLAQKAQQMAPESPLVNDTLGWAYFRKGDFATALSYLSRVSDKNSTAQEKYHLAVAYIKTGNATKGQQLLQAALKEDPRLAQTEQVASDLR